MVTEVVAEWERWSELREGEEEEEEEWARLEAWEGFRRSSSKVISSAMNPKSVHTGFWHISKDVLFTCAYEKRTVDVLGEIPSLRS